VRSGNAWSRRFVGDAELEEWGVRRGTALAYLLVPPVGAAVVALTALWDPLFRLLTAEDRIFEWAQFASWTIAAAASLAMGVRLIRSGRRLIGVLWLGLAVGLALVAGEEIAWGQRLFGLETPDALERVNRQGEITVHNIRGLSSSFAVVFVTAGLYGAGAALWFRRLRPARDRELVDLLVPPLFMVSLFLVVPVYKVVRGLLDLAGVPTLTDYGEYVELCLAFAFASFCVLAYRVHRRVRSALPAPTRVRTAAGGLRASPGHR
jgi:hypothetical protein